MDFCRYFACFCLENSCLFAVIFADAAVNAVGLKSFCSANAAGDQFHIIILLSYIFYTFNPVVSSMPRRIFIF